MQQRGQLVDIAKGNLISFLWGTMDNTGLFESLVLFYLRISCPVAGAWWWMLKGAINRRPCVKNLFFVFMSVLFLFQGPGGGHCKGPPYDACYDRGTSHFF